MTQISLNPEYGWHQLATGSSGNFTITTTSASPATFEIYDSQMMPQFIGATNQIATLPMAEGESYVIHLPDATTEVQVTLERLPDPPSTLRMNLHHRFDVNNDGRASPLDALQVINMLNAQDREIPDAGLFLDVSGDGHLSSLDVLLLFNELNKGRDPFAANHAEIVQRMTAALAESETAPERQIIKSSIQRLLPLLDRSGNSADVSERLLRRIAPTDALFHHGDDDWRWDIEALVDDILE